MAFHTHQQRGDQCGATHQPQRDQKTEGEGKGANMTVLQVTLIHIGSEKLQIFNIFNPVLMQVFKNPYHHGKINNWKLLFGVEKRR